jgi:hypothetical protein
MSGFGCQEQVGVRFQVSGVSKDEVAAEDLVESTTPKI